MAIFTEFVEKIPDLNEMIESDDFGITEESIINIQWNEKIRMYCVYWKDNFGKWIEGKNGTIKCNQCGCEIKYSYLIGNKPDFPKFCCDCGAKMQKGGAKL